MAFDTQGLKRGYVVVSFFGNTNTASWRYTTTDVLADVFLKEEVFSDLMLYGTYFASGSHLFQTGDTIWVDAYDGGKLLTVTNVNTEVNNPSFNFVDILEVANISSI